MVQCDRMKGILAQRAGERAVLALTKGVVMKNYELTVLVHPDLEMNLEPATTKIKDLIEKNGGKITKEQNDGKKRLAYSIKGQDFAVYYYCEVALPADAPAKIESALNITDEVLRHLLVTVDERKLKAEAKQAARQAHAAEAEAETEEEK